MFSHANLKILRNVRQFLRGRTTTRPHVLESLGSHCFHFSHSEQTRCSCGCSKNIFVIYSLSQLVTLFFRIFKTLPIPNRKSWGAEILRKCSPPPWVTCHMGSFWNSRKILKSVSLMYNKIFCTKMSKQKKTIS